MNEAGGVAGECSQAFKEGSYALHVRARVLGASARVAHCLQVWVVEAHYVNSRETKLPDGY